MQKQSFGEILREAREARGISMRGLATAADMDPAYLSRLENGKTGDPKQETVEKLGQALCGEADLDAGDCEKLNRRLLVAAGHLQPKEDLLDDLEDRFAARLRDEGFPESHIDSALARIPLATMRKVMLGEEKLEIASWGDIPMSAIQAREDAGEDVVAFSVDPSMSGLSDKEESFDLPSGTAESASDYISRHEQEFVRNRRIRQARSRSGPRRSFRAGKAAVIQVNKDLDKHQEQQLKQIARLIDTILQEK